MKILDAIKNPFNNLYKTKHWYHNNYNSLGSNWLFESIKQIPPYKEFVFASFSANAAYYEDDVYQTLKEEYDPYFYVGDLEDKLNDPIRASHDRFQYISSQGDAAKIKPSIIDNRKVDILLDCKGALWYALRLGDSTEEKAIQLLQKYRDLLAPTGLLLIDYYDHHRIDTIKYQLFMINYRRTKISYFGEASTKKCLQNVFGKDFVCEHCKELVISDINSPTLSGKMGTAILNVSAIDEMLNRLKTDNGIHEKFIDSQKKAQLFKIFISIGITMIVLFVMALLYFITNNP